MVCVYY